MASHYQQHLIELDGNQPNEILMAVSVAPFCLLFRDKLIQLLFCFYSKLQFKAKQVHR